MYYDLLAKFASVVEVLADRLLNRRVVLSVVALFVMTLFFSRLTIVFWVNKAAFLGLYLLFMLWLLNRVRRQREGKKVFPLP